MREVDEDLLNKRVRLFAYFFLILIFLVSSCGYSVHKKANLPFTDIQIGKINNLTFEPKLQDKLQRALADTFIQYGFEISPTSRYRLEGDITRFEIKTLSEKDLITTEYQIFLFCSFKLIDTTTNNVIKVDSITDPFVSYFSAKGRLENVLAQKESAVENSLNDLSKELIRYIIYKKVEVK